MIGYTMLDTNTNKSFQDLTTPLLIPHHPLHLLDLLSHVHYLFHHDYLIPLPFEFEHHRLSPKHDVDNGDRNSLKRNSLKTH